MYRYIVFILAIFCFSIQQPYSQSLDQVLARHFEASGQDAFSRVTTVRSAGKAMQMGMELPFIQIQKRPDKMYIEIDLQGMKMVQAIDGDSGWAVEPWMSPDARDLSGPELHNAGRMAGIDSDLINWEEKGYEIEYLGKELAEGDEMYRLKLKKVEGDTYHFFIDSGTYLIARMVTLTDYDGQIVEGETVLSDYRDVEGVMMPFRTETRYDGETLGTNVIEKIEFDVVIEDQVFSKP